MQIQPTQKAARLICVVGIRKTMVTMKEAISRKSIFENASAKLRQDFDELYSVPHSALKGAEAEKIIRSFLNKGKIGDVHQAR
jgi:hypothetical protein